ncbi:hypothetical protein H5410_021932 [Solanum commersonii]|uniref:Uncharacterized protein n=1 Tax=Solanum commersonii TaxID=4109 RepID=A0A9J5ZCG0_SOLCO|nr:hypothetical protein H5410_021932 [Solanum commersonii]
MLLFLHLCIHWNNSSNLTDLWFVEVVHNMFNLSIKIFFAAQVFLDDKTKKDKDIETLKEKLLKVEKDVDSLGKEMPQIEFNKHGRKSAKQVLTRKKNTI